MNNVQEGLSNVPRREEENGNQLAGKNNNLGPPAGVVKSADNNCNAVEEALKLDITDTSRILDNKISNLEIVLTPVNLKKRFIRQMNKDILAKYSDSDEDHSDLEFTCKGSDYISEHSESLEYKSSTNSEHNFLNNDSSELQYKKQGNKSEIENNFNVDVLEQVSNKNSDVLQHKTMKTVHQISPPEYNASVLNNSQYKNYLCSTDDELNCSSTVVENSSNVQDMKKNNEYTCSVEYQTLNYQHEETPDLPYKSEENPAVQDYGAPECSLRESYLKHGAPLASIQEELEDFRKEKSC